jgi:hypothetical protein
VTHFEKRTPLFLSLRESFAQKPYLVVILEKHAALAAGFIQDLLIVEEILDKHSAKSLALSRMTAFFV